MAYGAQEEDAPPMEMPKGILSGTDAMPMGGTGEQMAPGGGEHSDAETVHSESIMEAVRAGDSEALRDSLAAFVRECVRNYNKGEEKE